MEERLQVKGARSIGFLRGKFELPANAFDAQHETLVAAGYQPRDGRHPVLASRTMYIDDPDGNEVEFICKAPVI